MKGKGRFIQKPRDSKITISLNPWTFANSFSLSCSALPIDNPLRRLLKGNHKIFVEIFGLCKYYDFLSASTDVENLKSLFRYFRFECFARKFPFESEIFNWTKLSLSIDFPSSLERDVGEIYVHKAETSICKSFHVMIAIKSKSLLTSKCSVYSIASGGSRRYIVTIWFVNKFLLERLKTNLNNSSNLNVIWFSRI